MPVVDPYSQYLENQLKTATPGKLLVMTFDAAIRFTRTAQTCMQQHKLDDQNSNIRKVQNLLLELMKSINPTANPQLASNLDALYTYMFDRLTYANIHDNLPALEEVQGILTDLRSTWADAELSIRQSSEPAERVAA
jgi:flagellar protein FliS